VKVTKKQRDSQLTTTTTPSSGALTFHIVLFYLGTVYSGFMEASPHSVVQQILAALYLASVATTWMAIDAGSRRRFIPHSGYMIVLISWPFTVPVYLIWTRGFKGLGLSLLHAIGVMIAYSAGFNLAVITFSGVDRLLTGF